jgi:midasin (ATPase involved in ribosome maturation)
MKNTNLNQNAKVIVDYLEKYVENNEKCYDKLLQLVLAEKLDDKISDEQWDLIIDEAWALAYHKALEDSYLSPDEQIELNKIKELSLEVKTPGFKEVLRFKLDNAFRSINNEYKTRFPHPKPTPYNWY